MFQELEPEALVSSFELQNVSIDKISEMELKLENKNIVGMTEVRSNHALLKITYDVLE